MTSSLQIFTQINKFPLYLAIFLTPLFFLPLAQNVLDYPKQLLLLFLLLISLIGWLGVQMGQGKITLKVNKLLYLALLLLFVVLSLSVIFSFSPSASFFGWSESYTDSFVAFLSLFLTV